MNSMGSDRFRKAIGKVKDHTSISLARVSSSTTLPDLEVAIVKATRHEEYPAEERHIREIINLTTDSQTYVASCISLISARLDKTRNWIVALKVLILIQRLLHDGDPAYEREVFFATRRGTRLLNMSDFRDMSRSNSWDFSAFVRTYSLYLDEYLEYRMQGRREKHGSYDHDEDVPELETMELKSPENEKTNDNLFSRLQHLMQLLERFLACRPTGPARNHRIVMVALYPILKQSFDMYCDITDAISIFVDRFTELELSDSVKVYEILRRAGKQYDELDQFYDYCKSIGLARTSEYPEVDKIPQKKLDIMDKFIREKSGTTQYRTEEPESDVDDKASSPEMESPEPDMNLIKTLPEPEGFTEGKKEMKVSQEDLLNLGDGGQTAEEYADKVGLAFFDGGPASQQSPLPSGISHVVLDEMYQHGRQNSGTIATGSASSVAGMPVSASSSGGVDPFSASVPVAAPAYVQMAEMEKKQKLLVEEQMMWQQYQRDGLQEQVGVGKVQSNAQPN